MTSSDRSPYVSTGHLPPADLVRDLVRETHERFRSVEGGCNSNVYPALATVSGDLFGLCVAGTNGSLHAVGDADHPFSIMSVSKPFVFALICHALGPEEARRRIGVNATGLPFNSLAAIEHGERGRTNPMVNPGAIATTSLAPGPSAEARWRFIHDGLSGFAGRQLAMNEEVLASATATNSRNQAIARLLQTYGRIALDPTEATDLYPRSLSE